MHKIAIDESIVAQVKTQRGKLNRYDSLVGRKTALVVIDMQNAFMLPGMPVEVPAARVAAASLFTFGTISRAVGTSTGMPGRMKAFCISITTSALFGPTRLS